jgi:hypothetical protein
VDEGSEEEQWTGASGEAADRDYRLSDDRPLDEENSPAPTISCLETPFGGEVKASELRSIGSAFLGTLQRQVVVASACLL